MFFFPLSCFYCYLLQHTARPCQRCMKRDLASTCTDGSHRREKQDSYEECKYYQYQWFIFMI
ncbi:hypothetical protein BCR42DRAFT_136341 [Absidia repens]|uniref:Uncharacterized protein n=1 Tax=Absidia repens TaxID=90262 RepID=A0A1X2IYB1_9FUNG|nr:hypothetical protein BCR42DRAFT_136341 [Absidia repens]